MSNPFKQEQKQQMKQQAADTEEELLIYPVEWVGGKQQTDRPRISSDTKRWMAWVGLNTAAFMAAFSGVDWIDSFSFSHGIFALLSGLLTGVVFGGTQWLLLRKRLARPRAWFFSTFIGLMLMFGLLAAGVAPYTGLLISMFISSLIQVKTTPEVLRYRRLWLVFNPLVWSLTLFAAFTYFPIMGEPSMWLIPGLIFALTSSLGIRHKEAPPKIT